MNDTAFVYTTACPTCGYKLYWSQVRPPRDEKMARCTNCDGEKKNDPPAP